MIKNFNVQETTWDYLLSTTDLPAGTVDVLDSFCYDLDNPVLAYASIDYGYHNDPELATAILEAYNLIGEDIDFSLDSYEQCLSLTSEQFAAVVLLQMYTDCGLDTALYITVNYDPLYVCTDADSDETLDMVKSPDLMSIPDAVLWQELEDKGIYFTDEFLGSVVFPVSVYEGALLC